MIDREEFCPWNRKIDRLARGGDEAR